MKRIITAITAVMLLAVMPLNAIAADGKAIYDGKAQEFIFEPGSEYSPTDMFENFKDVMPGDSISQKITVRNDASNKVKVKIYMRSLGAHEDSVEFLNEMRLTVKKSQENEMAYMFDAAANETAQLTDWVCLGTLYSGGEVNLDVVLDVPKEMDNYYQEKIGYLDWEFKIEEFPIEEKDPKPPQTGDNRNIVLWIAVAGCSAVVMLVLVILLKRKKDEEK